MKIGTKTVQKCWTIMIILIELYKIGMGTFLIFCVPQRCNDHVCQIQEIVHDKDVSTRIAIYLNSFTLLTILFTYIWEWRREKWFMRHLDSVFSLPYDNLAHIARDSWSIERNLIFYNVHYLRALRVTAVTTLFNFFNIGICYLLSVYGLYYLTQLFQFRIVIIGKI